VSASVVRAFDGCYEARRAAALAGVPLSTVYYWARTEVVVPSISRERPKLWSYADLMGLRIVYWLRHPKGADGDALPASPMGEVRRALQCIDEAGLELWSPGPDEPGPSPLRVDRQGRIYVTGLDGVVDAEGQGVLDPDALDLLGVFAVNGSRGPDLRAPRERLRIVPGKVAGEPHVAGTRVTTPALAALHARGYPLDGIAELYPDLAREAIAEALDLEDALAESLAAAA
jgi:uncharacterized protein (DUF433 family)